MAKVVRPLLALGNTKLGASIFHWGIPAGETCPGKSAKCHSVCYSLTGRFAFPQVIERLKWNWSQAQIPDFADRLVTEIRKKGCLVIRVHSSGDFADKAYAEKWLDVMRRCPKVRFYWYSRSWRCQEIAPVLEQMAALKCCRAWYSVDSETGLPETIPPGVRLAYLQTQEGEQPELVDLMFRIRRLRKKRIPLSVLCPNESGPRGKEVNCGGCQRCFR